MSVDLEVVQRIPVGGLTDWFGFGPTAELVLWTNGTVTWEVPVASSSDEQRPV